nr:prolactin receptor-like [Solea senegalensis]XP_043872409.1 prolactin receptor-like [Solea senegalensis]XP_043872418.1 prolactin receptor-like [Solea senegalensis]XP_043872427.1 prolactin receptor-like [Solea senegalensis]
MLWPLLCLLPLAGCGAAVPQNITYKEGLDYEAVAVTTRPHIFNCRSPSMEDFTCWWLPVDNLTDVTYVLTYNIEKGPTLECPDYTTAGPSSCHFDKRHTYVWKVYCMNVTAIAAQRNYTSQQHCLDVADIVQTEAPVNLTYSLTDAGGHEMGHSAQLSWQYPVPSHLQYGWITLLYELQYRRVTEPDNWKVKYPLREPHVTLLGLPVSDYVIRVRCRSQNYGLWSKWSLTLIMSIPSKTPAGKLLGLILVTGVGVMALLVIAFGFVPQSRRLKEYFLPPIPKPRILGIDPQLLKKGHLDEINFHLSNFHSYTPPSYTKEIWEQVSVDSVCLTAPKDSGVPADSTDEEKVSLIVPCDAKPVAARHEFVNQNPASYVQSLSPYCSSHPGAFAPPLLIPAALPRPELQDYNVIGQEDSLAAPDVATRRTPPDLYTCVHLVNDSSQLHLVPYIAMPYCREFPTLPGDGSNRGEKEEEEEKKKLAEHHAKACLMKSRDDAKAEMSEASVPLLPVAVDNKC